MLSMRGNNRMLLPSAVLMCLGSVTFYVLGLIFPIVHTCSQVLGFSWNNADKTLWDSVVLFYTSKEYLLATIIFLFTMVVPIMKYIEIMVRLLGGLRAMNAWNIDKWNMIDVFVVALLLMTFKLNSSFIVMEIQIGTTFLAISVIMRILTVMIMSKIKYEK